jgi:hypothetical protein
MENTPGHDFLKGKYDLHNAPEVEATVSRTEARTDELVSQDPAVRIQNYLERFTGILERENPKHRERGVEALKHILHDKFVIKPEEIPEGYFDNQKRIARDQGHGDIEVSDEIREQLAEVIITDQRTTLDTWIDYLSSKDATYPDWLKYYAIRSVLGMGAYDKEKHQFGKRSKGTTKPFPDLNREALAYVLDAIEKNNSEQGYDFSTLAEEDRPQFEKLLTGENFAKLYAFAIEKVTPASPEQLTSTAGEWVKYDKGSDHLPLVQSLQGHGTGWCTAGESTAKVQLKNGDFYVFYSLDAKGQPIIPRAAIRMQEGKIGEVRGVAAEQNLDSTIAPVVEAKLKEFPDGAAYEKKTSDMKTLTAIEQAVKSDQPLTGSQLRFLYEIEVSIEGFGYERDPRIVELRATRNPEADMPIVFECSPDEIAHNVEEITEDTKAYVGPLIPGIFQMLPEDLEHIYTSFTEGRIRKDTVEIGGMSREELLRQLEEKGVNISDDARYMLNSSDFGTGEKPESADLVRLTVESLGFPRGATTNEIYRKAEELGLELCPAETAPHYRLKYADQPMDEWFSIGMKQIANRNGNPSFVFNLERHKDGLWLNDDPWARPDDRRKPEFQFAFRRPARPAGGRKERKDA